MTSAALLSLGPDFFLRFFQENCKVRAIKVAESAFDTILDPDGAGQTVAFLVHLIGKVIDFFRAIGDAEPTALAEFFNDGSGHAAYPPLFPAANRPNNKSYPDTIITILHPAFLSGQGKKAGKKAADFISQHLENRASVVIEKFPPKSLTPTIKCDTRKSRAIAAQYWKEGGSTNEAEYYPFFGEGTLKKGQSCGSEKGHLGYPIVERAIGQGCFRR